VCVCCALCNAMHSEQAVVRSLVSKLGDFTVSDSVVVSTTHIVCGDNRRTIKLLLGIARGCWIVSLDWVNSCFATLFNLLNYVLRIVIRQGDMAVLPYL